MVIKIDKEAEKLLTEIVDGYTKFVGLRGVNNVNVLMRSMQLLKEENVGTDEMPNKLDPKGESIEELTKVK